MNIKKIQDHRDHKKHLTVNSTQHFTVDKKGIHQIRRIIDYLDNTGRRGYLAVELRMGVGHGREAYLIPWEAVEKPYLAQNLKITNR